MGLGRKLSNGRYEPISSYKGSWADQEARRKNLPRELTFWEKINGVKAEAPVPPLVKPEPHNANWVTIGKLNKNE